jgi:hypothetical protein
MKTHVGHHYDNAAGAAPCAGRFEVVSKEQFLPLRDRPVGNRRQVRGQTVGNEQQDQRQ